MVIWQQLKVSIFSASLRRSQAGNLAIATLSGTVGTVRHRLVDF